MPVDEHVCRRLRSATRFGDIRCFEEIDSTNRWLRDEALAGAPEGLVAVADHQTAGRGRLDRTWESPAGASLLMSVLLRPAGLEARRLHLVTAAVALSALDAARAVGVDAELKWPNDLLVEDRKLAGVLAEAVAGPAVVVGIGCNIAWAPPGAASLAAAGAATTRDDVLEATLTGLERRLADGWGAVAAEHRRRCATIGRQVRVEVFDRHLTGTAADVDDDGQLVLDVDGGGRHVLAVGDVVHLRPAT